MRKSGKSILTAILLVLLFITFINFSVNAQEDEDRPVVRAVLFYSPTCGHCENLIQNQLPPLLEEYGDQLKIVAINTSLQGGQDLYLSAVERYEIPQERIVVPMLIVMDNIMVGGAEIPNQFPDIIIDQLANDGTDWPDIPGLQDVISEVDFSSHPPGSTKIDSRDSSESNIPVLSLFDKFMLDPLANSIAVIVLIGMIISIFWVVINFNRPLPEKDFWPKWVIPIMSVLGMGVAFYLTYVETSGVEAACGPVGDCNTVQLSPYAELFGFLPVGLLGLIGYVLLLAGWAIHYYGPKNLHWASSIAVWGMALFGVLFSIYLTFLEPFVIGATCMWCISSAIFQTIIFLAATEPAKRAWQEDDFDEETYETNINPNDKQVDDLDNFNNGIENPEKTEE